MKKLVNSMIGNKIYYATVNEKNGTITGEKKDVTEDAIACVAGKMMSEAKRDKTRFMEYKWGDTCRLILDTEPNKPLVEASKQTGDIVATLELTKEDVDMLRKGFSYVRCLYWDQKLKHDYPNDYCDGECDVCKKKYTMERWLEDKQKVFVATE